MKNQVEIWKDIPGYEGLYKASSFGRIMSYDKFCNNGVSLFLMKGKLLKQSINSSGYYCLCLYKNKVCKSFRIHKIIAMTFLNHIPNYYESIIDHIDNNKLNNNVNNLQIVSNRYNSTKDKKPKSGHSCIYLNGKSFLVRMRVNNIKTSIGTFKNIEDAIIKRDLFLSKL